jgi:hypothetical protein
MAVTVSIFANICQWKLFKRIQKDRARENVAGSSQVDSFPHKEQDGAKPLRNFTLLGGISREKWCASRIGDAAIFHCTFGPGFI